MWVGNHDRQRYGQLDVEQEGGETQPRLLAICCPSYFWTPGGAGAGQALINRLLIVSSLWGADYSLTTRDLDF